jgi:hypothetical protein
VTRDELIAKAEEAMSDWYSYHDVTNPWCRGCPMPGDQEDVEDWHRLFILLATAWGLVARPDADG